MSTLSFLEKEMHETVIQKITLPELSGKLIEADVLRLDHIHPVISGNKWFKLRYYLQEAVLGGYRGLISFGGAWSNHIVAVACAAQKAGLPSAGIIRGERPLAGSRTLADADGYGMQLEFVSRELYNTLRAGDGIEAFSKKYAGYLIIPEGGAGLPGIQGAETILDVTHCHQYSHILCAAGTGTMLAGISHKLMPHQQATGIQVLKGAGLAAEYLALVNDPVQEKLVHINEDYHFGGYAKKNPVLLDFMNNFFRSTGIPSDFVYTGKLFFAFMDLATKNYFAPASKILLIHSGGLQGNLSLPKGTLTF